jgi:hypothetical protein
MDLGTLQGSNLTHEHALSGPVLTSPELTLRLKECTSSLRHVWEIEGFLKCPLIGACLSIEQHRRILNKAGFPTKRSTPYQLHRAIMDHLDGKNRISIKVDNYLRHKYCHEIPALKDLDEETFMETWRVCMNTGKMFPAFFVAVTRPGMSEASLTEIFGDVHMLNHANLDEVNQSRRDLSQQMDANRKLSRLLQQQKERTNRNKKEVSTLRSSLQEARSYAEQLRQMIKSRHSKDNEMAEFRRRNQALKEQIRHLQQEVEQGSRQRKRAERQKEQLQNQVFDLQTTNDRFAEELNFLIAQLSSYVECKDQRRESCPKLELCAKRILIVGGIIRMKQLYRNLIESSGGEFEYHDGYMHGGKQKLEDQVKRCDVVVCPVNCNSHGACNEVKKLCQKYQKPVKMLPNSSLNAIANVLLESREHEN